MKSNVGPLVEISNPIVNVNYLLSSFNTWWAMAQYKDLNKSQDNSAADSHIFWDTIPSFYVIHKCLKIFNTLTELNSR